MKGFLVIFQLAILTILFINQIILFIYLDNFKLLSPSLKYMIIIIITVIEFVLIAGLIEKFFAQPINKLEHTIKHFLSTDEGHNLKDREWYTSGTWKSGNAPSELPEHHKWKILNPRRAKFKGLIQL